MTTTATATLARQFQAAIDRYSKGFDESQVNRDEQGQFATKEGQGSTSEPKPQPQKPSRIEENYTPAGRAWPEFPADESDRDFEEKIQKHDDETRGLLANLHGKRKAEQLRRAAREILESDFGITDEEQIAEATDWLDDADVLRELLDEEIIGNGPDLYDYLDFDEDGVEPAKIRKAEYWQDLKDYSKQLMQDLESKPLDKSNRKWLKSELKDAVRDMGIGREDYSLAQQFDRAIARYTKDEKWITIGGEKEGDKNHVGGTPVKIDGQGNIKAGPAALAEKGIKNLKDFGGGEKEKKATAPQPKSNSGKGGKIPTTADEAKVGTVEHNGQKRPLYAVDGLEWTHDLPEGSLGEDYEVIIADVGKVDQAWEKYNNDMRIPPGGGGAEIGGRRKGFREWREKNPDTPIEMSRLDVIPPGHEYNPSDEPIFGFSNGRHRFSIMRDDLKKTAVPVVVSKSTADAAREMFGYDGGQQPKPKSEFKSTAQPQDDPDNGGFSLKRESNKTRKKAEFDDSGKGKQGGLFDTGKNDIKGQNLMFDDHYNPQEAMEDAKRRKENKGKSVLDLPTKGEGKNKIPSIPKGKIRLTHFTANPDIVEGIMNGAPFSYKGQGKIAETTDAFTSDSDVSSLIDTGKTGAFSRGSFGNSVILMDMDPEEHRVHDDYISAPENGEVPNDRILGVVDRGTGRFTANPGYNPNHKPMQARTASVKPGNKRNAPPPMPKPSPSSGSVDLDVFSRQASSRLTAEFDRAFYARMTPKARYACQWITLSAKSSSGDKSGGAKVCIGDGGKIEKGPKALKRKKISSIVGPQNAVDEAIRDGARRHGVKKADLKAAVEDVLKEKREIAKEREEMKTMARQWVGMTPGQVEDLKNRYLDYDSIPGFDDAASELVNSHPELGIHPDNASEGVWELIQEPRENLPKKTDPDIIKEAAERLKAGDSFGPVEVPSDEDYVPFSRMRQAFDREFYRRGFRVPVARETLVDRFNRAFAVHMPAVERYAERWITIGGNQEGDKKHAGGTPVKIDDDGNIKAGPAGLAAKGIKNLNDFGKNPQSADNSTRQTADNSNNGGQSKGNGPGQKQGKQKEGRLMSSESTTTPATVNKVFSGDYIEVTVPVPHHIHRGKELKLTVTLDQPQDLQPGDKVQLTVDGTQEDWTLFGRRKGSIAGNSDNGVQSKGKGSEQEKSTETGSKAMKATIKVENIGMGFQLRKKGWKPTDEDGVWEKEGDWKSSEDVADELQGYSFVSPGDDFQPQLEGEKKEQNQPEEPEEPVSPSSVRHQVEKPTEEPPEGFEWSKVYDVVDRPGGYREPTEYWTLRETASSAKARREQSRQTRKQWLESNPELNRIDGDPRDSGVTGTIEKASGIEGDRNGFSGESDFASYLVSPSGDVTHYVFDSGDGYEWYEVQK